MCVEILSFYAPNQNINTVNKSKRRVGQFSRCWGFKRQYTTIRGTINFVTIFTNVLLVLSTELISSFGHRLKIRVLTFQKLCMLHYTQHLSNHASWPCIFLGNIRKGKKWNVVLFCAISCDFHREKQYLKGLITFAENVSDWPVLKSVVNYYPRVVNDGVIVSIV